MCLPTVEFDRKQISCDSNLDGFNYTYTNCSNNQSHDSHFVVPEMDTHNSLHVIPYNASSSLVLDASKFNFPNPIWYIKPTGDLILKTSTFIPVMLLGVIGNVMLLTIIIRNKNLQTPTNLLIANMAIADLLTVLICPIFFMIHEFYQNYELGALGCKTEGLLEGALLISGVLNLVAVSYDRLTAIVLPRETRLTLKGAKIVMGMTWIVGVLLATPLMIYRTYKERQWKNFHETYCSENINILPLYWHVIISALVWFPMGVMLICYVAIFWKLDRYEANVLKRENPISVSYKTRVARMLFIVVIVFIILRVPFTALVFIRNQLLKNSEMNQATGSFHDLWYASHYILFVNPAVNPIIYGLTNENFRRAYRNAPFLRCCFSESSKNLDYKEKSNLDKSSRTNNKNKSLDGSPACDDKQPSSGRWYMFNVNHCSKLYSKTKSATVLTDFGNSTSTLTTDSTNEIKIISNKIIPEDKFDDGYTPPKTKHYL